MENKMISVVIPMYRCSRYLPQLVDNLNQQTFKQFETIFVDDASADNTIEVLEDLLKTVDFSYRIIASQTNGGAGAARNLGMRDIKSTYFCYLDADDTFSENYLKELYDIAQAEDAEVVISSVVRLYESGEEKIQTNALEIKNHNYEKERLICNLDIGICGKLFRTSLWDFKCCDFPGKWIGEDGATIPVLYEKAKTIAFAPEAIYYYHQTSGSRSRASAQKYNDIFEVCRVMQERISSQSLVEFYFAIRVGYGVIVRAIEANAKKSELLKYSDYLRTNFPRGYKNQYLSDKPLLKRLCVRCTYFRAFLPMKIYVGLTKRNKKKI